jgi:hypothetical protein
VVAMFNVWLTLLHRFHFDADPFQISIAGFHGALVLIVTINVT